MVGGGAVVDTVIKFLVPFKTRNFFNDRATVSLSKWASIHEVSCSEMSVSA
jgi:hypothetical protein